jgi:hypothetical protein
MRTLILLLGLLTACAKRPLQPAARPATPGQTPACPLHVLPGPPTLTFYDTQQAVQAFDQEQDTAYVVLYIRKVSGFPGSNRCLLVRQQSATRFLVHQYETPPLTKNQVTDATWYALLAQLTTTPGHLESICIFTTDPSIEYLIVKHQGKVVFSLFWATDRSNRLTVAEQARIAPALTLMRYLGN